MAGVAQTGAQALSAASELRPQMLLLDIYLPHMRGLEVLQRLRFEDDRAGVIMLTAARERRRRLAPRQARANRFFAQALGKPAAAVVIRQPNSESTKIGPEGFQFRS